MTALITGATAGIGRAFADVLAEEGADLVLVARTTERLDHVAAELTKEHGVRVTTLPADLSTVEGCRAVMDRLAAQDDPIDLLVNNAGLAVNQKFVTGDLAAEEYLLDVLVMAPLRLTHAALQAMVARGSGRVINVSSVAGFFPYGTYSAAKTWVTVFTEGLQRELSGTGVTATAVCPGFTRTEFHERANMQMGGMPDFAWLDARQVARDGLADARRGHVLSVPSKRYTALALVGRYGPRPLVRMAGGARDRVAHQ